MKTTYLLYEITDKKKHALKLIDEVPQKKHAKNEKQKYAGKGKKFVIVKALEA